MLLKGKNLVIYGGGGSVGSAIAREFSKEGARIFLAGRALKNLQVVANDIISAGGYVEFSEIDALDEEQVSNYLEKITRQHKRIDISINVIGIDDVQGLSLIDMPLQDFLSPIQISMRTQFITSSAAGKIMKLQGGGVILMLSANAAKKPTEKSGGFGVAGAAIEALTRQFALELGRYNIRVICLRSAGSPDAKGVDEVFNVHAKERNISRAEFQKQFEEKTMLKRLPSLDEIAQVASLMASAKANVITGAIINVTCGEIAD